MNAAHVASAALLAYAAWEYARQASDDAGNEGGDGATWLTEADQAITEGYDMIKGLVGGWRAPAQYAPAIQAAEARYGIPAGLLERLLYQESRYREDIITGRVRSKVGALGIAQFMPATAADLRIDPLNPDQAIDGAGRYLSSMYKMFGSWQKALAAYNWGPGNVQRKGIAAAPLETRLYYAQIMGAVGVA